MNEEMVRKIEEAEELMRQSKANLAVSVLKQTSRAFPRESYLYYLLGIARMKCGRFFLAQRAFLKANELSPNHAEILRSLGYVKTMLGELETGRNYLRESINLDLTNPLAYMDLAMSYFNCLEFEEGFEWLDRAKALGQKDQFVLDNYKRAEEERENFSKYPKDAIEKMKQERKRPETIRETRLSMLSSYAKKQPISGDDEKEIQEELRLNGVSDKFSVLPVSDRKEKDLFLVSSNNQDELYDNCPVCQAMKKAKEEGRKPTTKELKKAMEKSKAQGGTVGGEWFDKKYN